MKWGATCSPQKGIDMKKLLKKIWNEIVFLLTGKGEHAKEMIENDLIDYSGQGKNKYGK